MEGGRRGREGVTEGGREGRREGGEGGVEGGSWGISMLTSNDSCCGVCYDYYRYTTKMFQAYQGSESDE